MTATDGEQRAGAGDAYVTRVTTIGSADVPPANWISRQPFVIGNVALVPLTQDAVTIIDAADAELAGELVWYLHRGGGGRGYAAHRLEHIEGRPLLYLHQLIARPPRGLDVDHIDGDGLNNRRANLRHATRRQNLANTRARNRLGLKGVWERNGSYRASIQINGKTRHMGPFATAEEAANAYRDAARAEHGEFAAP